LKKSIKTTVTGYPCEPEVRFGVCRVKIALQAIFQGFMREAQQTPGLGV
jgi:hypothetical protein